MAECFRCGREGHRAAQCGWTPAPPPPRADESMWRVPASEVAADPHAHAAAIRRAMGWPDPPAPA